MLLHTKFFINNHFFMKYCKNHCYKSFDDCIQTTKCLNKKTTKIKIRQVYLSSSSSVKSKQQDV